MARDTSAIPIHFAQVKNRHGQAPAEAAVRKQSRFSPFLWSYLLLYVELAEISVHPPPAPLAAAARLHLEIRAALRKIASSQSPGAGLVVKPARRAPRVAAGRRPGAFPPAGGGKIVG